MINIFYIYKIVQTRCLCLMELSLQNPVCSLAERKNGTICVLVSKITVTLHIICVNILLISRIPVVGIFSRWVVQHCCTSMASASFVISKGDP